MNILRTNIRHFSIPAVLITLSLAVTLRPATAEKVTMRDLSLTTKDHVEIYGDYYPAANASKSIVLLFHQAGSNRGEYLPIAPHLNRLGFDALAIDQRSGGKRWGQPNQTVDKLGKSASYLEALPDLKAALDWAATSGKYNKIYLWGSSYSASLVFLVAQEHPDVISGILSFSPGEYLGSKTDEVQRAAKKTKTPSIILTPEKEKPAAQTIFDVLASQNKRFIVPPRAVHGSSMLRPDRNKNYNDVWPMVEIFLKNPDKINKPVKD